MPVQDYMKLISVDDHVVEHPTVWQDRLPERYNCGGSTRITERFHYGSTKFAGEAVARALSRIHQMPLTIARLNWSYGKAGYGGLPAPW